MKVIWVKREQDYFCGRGWTGVGDLPVGRNQWAQQRLRRHPEVRAAFGEPRRMLLSHGGPSFEARKSAHLRMTQSLT
jgi:hypothetical protein